MAGRERGGSEYAHARSGDPFITGDVRGCGVGVGGISTFSEHTTVSTHSAVRIPDDIPLDAASLVGCGVATGWGSAVVSADVAPGDTVIVMGVGGIGINAVPGARFVGAVNVIAVDPVEFKRHFALKLDELITTRYGLDDIALGYEDMHAGTNIRGIIDFDQPVG